LVNLNEFQPQNAQATFEMYFGRWIVRIAVVAPFGWLCWIHFVSFHFVIVSFYRRFLGRKTVRNAQRQDRASRTGLRARKMATETGDDGDDDGRDRSVDDGVEDEARCNVG
jgi:hypothetical protein